MTKQELVEKIADNAGVTQKQAYLVLDAAIDAIVDSVAAGEQVKLTGFGIFEVKKREGHIGRNPKTLEVINIAPSAVPVFRPGKPFKRKVADLADK